MRKFIVLLKKEVKELLSPQFMVPLFATIFIFVVMGKVVAKQKIGSAAGETIAILDLDKSALSGKAIEALRGAKYQVEVQEGDDPAAALSRPGDGKNTALIVIPKGLEKDLKEQKPHDIEVYRRFKGLGVKSLVSATMGSRAVRIISNTVGDLVAKMKFPGVDVSFIKNPLRAKEFVVLDGKVERASIAEIGGFLQSQTKLVPIVIFVVIVFASQMVALTVASEKENKTLEILLSSPVPRRSIVVAKIMGAGIVALCFTAAYMIGMRAFMDSIIAEGPSQVSEAALREALVKLGLIISPGGFALIGLSVLFGILCALGIALIMGILADDVKAVHAANAPLMITVLFAYMMTLLVDMGSVTPGFKLLLYAIPFTHAFLAPQNVLMHDYGAVWWGIWYQAVVFLGFVAVAGRIFSSEAVLTMRLWRLWAPLKSRLFGPEAR